MNRDTGLDVLLDLSGTKYVEENHYWWKVEASLTQVTKERPHGVSYCLTFHDNYGKRIFGIDNAHAIKNRRKGYKGRIVEYDHMHTNALDKGTLYVFVDAEQLMQDFLDKVNEIMSSF